MTRSLLNDLAAVTEALDAEGVLERYAQLVGLRHELVGIARSADRPILFEQVEGTAWPVLAGLYGAGAMRCTAWRDLIAEPRLVEALRREAAAPPDIVEHGAVTEVMEAAVDLRTLPVPVHALDDAAPHLTAVALHKDPETGARRLGLVRLQVAGPTELLLEEGGDGALREAAARVGEFGRSLWVTLHFGAPPAACLVAALPHGAGSFGSAPLAVAAGLMGRPVRLVAGRESDVEMLDGAQIALECEMRMGEAREGGVLADPWGRMVPAGPRPRLTVHGLYRRSRPLLQTILGEEYAALRAAAATAHLTAQLAWQVPGLASVHVPPSGACRVAVLGLRPGAAAEDALLAALAACPELRLVTAVDDDIAVADAAEVAWAMATRHDPVRGRLAFGSRIGLDATANGARRPRARFLSAPVPELARALPALPASARVEASVPQEAEPSGEARAQEQFDFDLGRIWERELAEWKAERAADTPPAQPIAGPDWDEERWWRRAQEEMKAERVAPKRKRPEPEPPRPQTSRKGPEIVPPRRTSDWDEERWWRREMEAPSDAPKPGGAETSQPALDLRGSTKEAPTKEPPPKRARKAPPPLRDAAKDEGGFFG